MSAPAVTSRPSGLASVIQSELATAKQTLTWIDIHPLGAKVDGLYCAVARLINCIEVLAEHCDARHHGLVLNCLTDANVDLRDVLHRLELAEEKRGDK